MARQGLTLQRLAYFVEVARAGSFRQAAPRLHVQQPGLSAQVDALEKVLDARLFRRTRRGVELTPIGQQLLPKAEDVLTAAERFDEYCKGMQRGESGVVSIACYPVHIERFLAKVIGSFRTEQPNIRVDLTKVRDDRRRHAGRSLLEELLAGEVDLAMAPASPQMGLGGMKAWDAKIRVLLPIDHPQRGASEVPITLLRDQPLLIAPPDYFSRESVASSARAAGFSLDVLAESSTPPALIALGMSGLGWPVLPDDYSLISNSEPSYPVLIDREGKELSTPVWLHWKEGIEQIEATRMFIECARRWIELERDRPGIAAADYVVESSKSV